MWFKRDQRPTVRTGKVERLLPAEIRHGVNTRLEFVACLLRGWEYGPTFRSKPGPALCTQIPSWLSWRRYWEKQRRGHHFCVPLVFLRARIRWLRIHAAPVHVVAEATRLDLCHGIVVDLRAVPLDFGLVGYWERDGWRCAGIVKSRVWCI